MQFPDTFATRYTEWKMQQWVEAQGWTRPWGHDQELVKAYNRKYEAVHAQATKDFEEDPNGFTARALAEVQEHEPEAIERFLRKQKKARGSRRIKKGPRHTKPKKRR